MNELSIRCRAAMSILMSLQMLYIFLYTNYELIRFGIVIVCLLQKFDTTFYLNF